MQLNSMKRLLVLGLCLPIGALPVLTSCSSEEQASEASEMMFEEPTDEVSEIPTDEPSGESADGVYGVALQNFDHAEIAVLNAEPDAWVGKNVQVTGEITDVCPMAGCWIKVKDENGEEIKVKVKDGEIVFPQDCKGKMATVEGEVYTFDLTKEEAIEYHKHLAEEKGEAFDASTVTGPEKVYQIQGVAAVVK